MPRVLRLGCGVIAALLAIASAAGPPGEEAAAAPGDSISGYTARLLSSEERVALASFRGRVVLVNAWATWCAPCLQELPAFEAAHRRHRAAGLVVVGVNVDEGRADDTVQQFVDGMHLGFSIWRDPTNQFAKRFQVRGVPETLLLDREGRIARRWRGPMDPTDAANRDFIESLLKAEAAGFGSGP